MLENGLLIFPEVLYIADMYESENELVNDFLNSSELFLDLLSPYSKGKRKFVLTEFDSEFGIADIVLGEFKKNAHISDIRHVNPNWLNCLNSLEKNEEFTLSDFVSQSSVSKQLSRKMLRHFEDSGYVVSYENDVFVKKRDVIPVIEKVISIEAKLYDWKKAIRQAYRYKRFSNQSFVLLPEDKSRQAILHIEEFKKYNIGLVTLGDSELVIHYEPNILNHIKLNALSRVNEFAVQRYQVS